MTDTPRRLEAPEWYDPNRRAIWDDTVRRLTAGGQVFKADPRVLDAYVAAAATHEQASRLLAQTSVLITRDGKAVENPALAVQRRTAADLAAASKALGLGRQPLISVLTDSPLSHADERRWCEEHSRRECKHRRQDGSWCHSFAVIAGTGSCKKHAGMSVDKARQKGQVNLARLYGPPADLDPGGALLEEVRHSAGHVRDLRQRVAEMAEAPGPDGEPGSGLWWGLVSERDRDGQVEREYRAGPHVILKAYAEERAHLVRAASAAHTAGAQQQAADVAAAVGASITRLVDEILEVLELDERQRALVPERVPAVLRRWNPEGTG